MSKKHKIGWLNIVGRKPETWNPIVGCSKVSDGCRNCYAERMAYRLHSMGNIDYRLSLAHDSECIIEKWNGETHLVESALEKPLGWKKPRVIFVNSMGDLFHENTPDDLIESVFEIIGSCPDHLFIVLTKRPERMAAWFGGQSAFEWPLPNVWLGVTAENQETADERIPVLLKIPAAVRFVSCEPMLGPVDISALRNGTDLGTGSFTDYAGMPKLDWVICGGESGSGARPMRPGWARGLRDQCESADVPFFFKQWGYGSHGLSANSDAGFDYSAGRNGGDVLDGAQHHNWPGVAE